MIPWPKKAKKIQFLISSNHNQPSHRFDYTQAYSVNSFKKFSIFSLFKTMPSSRVSNSLYFKERRRGLLLKITFFADTMVTHTHISSHYRFVPDVWHFWMCPASKTRLRFSFLSGQINFISRTVIQKFG